jgi:ABC-type phosphate/phosphonate transport system substrate-binding protein
MARFWKHLSEREPNRVSGLKVIWVSPPFSHYVFTASGRCAAMSDYVTSRFSSLRRKCSTVS